MFDPPRCCPTTTTSKSQPRSLQSKLPPDTTRAIWTDKRLRRPHNRQGQTDKLLVQTHKELCKTLKQDMTPETQTRTLGNTVFILANLFPNYTLHMINLGTFAALQHSIFSISFFPCLLSTVICLLSQIMIHTHIHAA